MELLEKVLGWGLGGLMVLALAHRLCHRPLLHHKMAPLADREKRTPNASIRALFAALWASLAGACRKILRGVRGYQNAAELYGALLGWAGRSGFPRDRSETPLEFGTRLNARFPALKPPIERIIDAYNREVYGETVLGGARIAAANSAWQFLRSPLRWPARFKGWLASECSQDKSNIYR